MSAPTPEQDPWMDAVTDFRAPLLVLSLLAIVAGYCDAVALQEWNVFVANQSGNVVRIGMGIAGGFPDWPLSLMSAVTFAAGSAASYAVGRRPRRVAPPAARLLVAVAALLLWSLLYVYVAPEVGTADVAAAWGGLPALAFAMGVLATTFMRLGGVRVTTTYATGAVLSVGRGAVRAVSGPVDGRRQASRLLGVTAVMLVSYAAGAAAGTLAGGDVPALARSLLPVVALLVVAALLRHRRPDGDVAVAQQGNAR